MAVPLIGHLQARLGARFHVQLRLASPPTVERTPAVIPVAGHVVRVFRGRPILGVGDEVRFFLHVCRPGDEIPPGPEFMSYESLLRATHLEAYLNGSPPATALALDECVIIDGPTSSAQLRASRLSYLTQLLVWHLR